MEPSKIILETSALNQITPERSGGAWWSKSLFRASPNLVDAFQVSRDAGVLFSAWGILYGETDSYILLFDSPVRPVVGQAAQATVAAYGNGNWRFDFTPAPFKFSRGLWVAVSSNAIVATGGEAVLRVHAQFLNEAPNN
jgi:hypothetical protein